MAELTAKEFSQHLNTKFRIRAESGPGESADVFELELAEVQPFAGFKGDQQGLERFSLFFTAAPNVRLAQGTFLLEHEQMGELAMFLVPVSSENGLMYEAVFNYWK
jgi:hypothetical protein